MATRPLLDRKRVYNGCLPTLRKGGEMPKPPKTGQPRKPGRPVTNTMPPPIPDTPENVTRAIMRAPPKKEWRYLTQPKKTS